MYVDTCFLMINFYSQFELGVVHRSQDDWPVPILLQALEKIGLQSRPELSHRLKAPGYSDTKDGIVMDRKIQSVSVPPISVTLLLPHSEIQLQSASSLLIKQC